MKSSARYIIREAAHRGHSLSDEIIRRLRSSREEDVREQALCNITSIVQAADSTISEIQRLLMIVKPAEPAVPAHSADDAAISLQSCA